ncbi:ABC transporter permease [Treponema parvum]|uniref:ABC transporter permease n=1 Tax=Treponema parvum TaxID=138851 RepID=A0A975F394_9SPIR|nr:ABC transporter permease [Treponema parvum]QTQ13714.1 ABC transporter permease [Treponema parvum]
MNVLLGIIPSVLMISSPILITAAGGMICERSGVTNIALEGLLGIGAFCAASTHVLMESFFPYSEWFALAVGAVFGMLFSLIHAYASISLNADQTVSGTGINLLSTGVTIFFSQILFSSDRTRPYKIGMFPGPGGIYPTAYIALAVIIISWFMLYKIPFGLRLRACGEHPDAAASVGVNVRKMRYFAVLASGLLAGLAGGCLVLTETIQYTSNTINGTGFISLAAVSFGRWSPLGITGSSLLFGAAVAFAIYVVNIPVLSNMLPAEFFNLLPYVITLLALVIFSGKNYAPAANGKPYVTGAS